MDAHAADAEGLGDGGGAVPGLMHGAHLLDRHRRLAAAIDALRLRLLDPGLLALVG